MIENRISFGFGLFVGQTQTLWAQKLIYQIINYSVEEIINNRNNLQINNRNNN